MPKFKIYQKLVDKITLITRENLTGLRVIRAFNNEKLEKSKFGNANNDLTRLSIYLDKILKLEGPLINIIFNGLTLLCTYIGITLLSKDFSYLGDMSAFAQYVSFVMMSFLMMSMMFVMIPRANVCAERINEILKIKSKIQWKPKTKGIPDKVASIEFRNVDFRYPGAEEKMLDNITFTAKAGESTAFIGSTGSGKSTLINLVPRFYDVTEGEVLVDGLDVREYKISELNNKIGYVPQRAVIFDGTVSTNVAYGDNGKGKIHEKKIKEAIKVAQAKNFVEKLPHDYSAHLAQGGTNVSGGQKQRLAIVRAIARDPEIYIFDDSFSALDYKTDSILRKELQKYTKDATSLIVAQRIGTIMHADKILVLDKGRCVGMGTHQELLKNCEVYKQIALSQLSKEELNV
jgi:ATP-binding cassette subfamily B protein